jgi:hypothetical protein
LILEPTGRVEDEFRRIGIAEVPWDDGIGEGWERCTVTVI